MKTSRRNPIAQFFSDNREAPILAVLLVVALVFTVANPRFASVENIQDMLRYASVLIIAAVGQSMVIITRNIDLSTGSIVGVSAYLSAVFVQTQSGLGVWLSLLVGMGIGLALGAVNAALVVLGGVPSIIATLGTLFAFRGIAAVIGGGDKEIPAAKLPQEFIDIASGRVLGIPSPMVIALVTVIIAVTALRKTRTGRELYAVGSNPEAAKRAGLRPKRLVAGVLCVSGALAGLVGCLWVSDYATVNAATASGFELAVISAVVVGGVSVFGGSGSVVGAAIGAVLMVVIQYGLIIMKVPVYWLQAAYGLLILVSVVSDTIVARRVSTANLLKRAAA